MPDPLASVPAGYAPHDLRMGYAELLGPVYRCLKDDAEWLGLRVAPRHANLGPMAHGGLIASLADIVMGRLTLRLQEQKRGCVSVTLNIEYLRSAPLGSWLEACATPERVGSSLAFVSCRLLADGELVALGHSVLKYLPRKSAGSAP